MGSSFGIQQLMQIYPKEKQNEGNNPSTKAGVCMQ